LASLFTGINLPLLCRSGITINGRDWGERRGTRERQEILRMGRESQLGLRTGKRINKIERNKKNGGGKGIWSIEQTSCVMSW